MMRSKQAGWLPPAVITTEMGRDAHAPAKSRGGSVSDDAIIGNGMGAPCGVSTGSGAISWGDHRGDAPMIADAERAGTAHPNGGAATAPAMASRLSRIDDGIVGQRVRVAV